MDFVVYEISSDSVSSLGDEMDPTLPPAFGLRFESSFADSGALIPQYEATKILPRAVFR